MQLEKFLMDFISIPSITGSEEEATEFLAAFLAGKGLEVRQLPVVGERKNLLASLSDSPEIILTSHIDVVPPWFPAKSENGVIYGRGACDAKGIIAAQIKAWLELSMALKRKVGFLYVIGEETDSIGAKTMLKQPLRPRYFINGEPTENSLISAQKGVFSFKLKASGVPAHSGYPQNGESAISNLLYQLAVLQNMDWGTDEDLGAATFNIGTIEGGRAANVIPDLAASECSVRVVTSSADVRKTLDSCKVEGVEYEITAASEPVHLFVPEGWDSNPVSFGSDAAYFSKIAPTLMLGPGSIHHAHSKDECIKIQELHTGIEMYRSLIIDLLQNEV